MHNTTSQSPLPALGKKIASKANRDGVAERCADPAVQKSLAVDLPRIGHDDALLRAVALPIVKTAKHHDATTLSLLQTVPGIGTILRRVLLYEIPDSARFPRVQDCASSGRRVTCAHESAGKRSGTAGRKIGNAHLQWAISEAAVVFLRDTPAEQKWLTRLEKNTARAQPCPSWHIQWPGRSIPCCNARRRVISTHSCGPQGGEPVRSRPHWTARG